MLSSAQADQLRYALSHSFILSIFYEEADGREPKTKDPSFWHLNDHNDHFEWKHLELFLTMSGALNFQCSPGNALRHHQTPH